MPTVANKDASVWSNGRLPDGRLRPNPPQNKDPLTVDELCGFSDSSDDSDYNEEEEEEASEDSIKKQAIVCEDDDEDEDGEDDDEEEEDHGAEISDAPSKKRRKT
jgi:hypothetical protein